VQFYLDGYRAGDPRVHPAAPDAFTPDELFPEEVDVLIVGVLAAQLADVPGIRTRVVERRDGPLERGQADGVACRTVEMFQAFGLADTMLAEGYWVNESVFWGPDVADPTLITRTGVVRDTEDGLSEMPHVIVNQARLQDYLLERMRKSPTRLEPDYGVEFVALEVEASGDHPVVVTLRRGDEEFTVRATYVVGCDGSRSGVRAAIGRELRGDVANHAWAVLDVFAVTDYPDWRKKSLIQSAHAGSILLIPREGGLMVRLYVDLGEVTDRDSLKAITQEQVIAMAQSVFAPYELDVREVAWFSLYEVGQRLTDKFDDVPAEELGTRLPHVFIAGDACHTHSAKAGQGMNVSMQDTFNLGWKLTAVLEGRSAPELLHTYSAERQTIAQNLIDFDREWSATIARPPVDPEHPEPRARRIAGGIRGLRPLHGRPSYAVHAVRADRRGDVSGARGGVPARNEISLSPRCPHRGCQGDPARPRARSRWAVAPLRVRRCHGVPGVCAARAPWPRHPAPIHSRGCRPRLCAQRARGVPGWPPRPGRHRPARGAPAPKGTVRSARLRERLRRQDPQRGRHLRRAGHRPIVGCPCPSATRSVRCTRPPTRRVRRTRRLPARIPAGGMMTDEPEPLRYTGHLIRRAQQRHVALWQERVSAEVSSVQYAALSVLERMPGANQSELGEELDLDRSTIADIVSRLERRGVIERSAHVSDRRRNVLRLTDTGLAEVARLRPLVTEANSELTTGLSAEELTTLRALLTRILSA
jgi:2-polyprenyl-6-methoxyphenol hydroxylase-like FAD-dependent oxidoreductase/DNA-binding MarR family transcriptional regulator